MFNRRNFLQTIPVLGALALHPRALLASSSGVDITQKLEQSDLIYLTPIQSNGKQSQCQSEIWFVWDGQAIYVCTDTDSWRSKAARQGLHKTDIWVGDVGVWQQSNRKYRELPKISAKAEIIENQSAHSDVLDLFADKYPIGWLRWGSKFKDGLSDGTRTLIKYHPQL